MSRFGVCGRSNHLSRDSIWTVLFVLPEACASVRIAFCFRLSHLRAFHFRSGDRIECRRNFVSRTSRRGFKGYRSVADRKAKKVFVFKSIKTSIEFKLFRVRKFGIAISLFLLKILGSHAVGLQGETSPTSMEASYKYALWRAIKVAIESKLLNVNWGKNRKKVINWRSLNSSREHRFTVLLNWLCREVLA